jgi:hypothetical protein
MISLNSLEYNKEDDGSGIVDTLWNDDRYLSIWEVGDFFDQSENPEHPSMDIRASNGRIYGAWSNYAASAAYYARPNSQATGRTQIFSTYDPPEWTDMAMEQGGEYRAQCHPRKLLWRDDYNGLGIPGDVYQQRDPSDPGRYG